METEPVKRVREDDAVDTSAASRQRLEAASAKPGGEAGAKAAVMCVIHCLKTGDKVPANMTQIMEMSGTIKAMVEDQGAEAGAGAGAGHTVYSNI